MYIPLFVTSGTTLWHTHTHPAFASPHRPFFQRQRQLPLKGEVVVSQGDKRDARSGRCPHAPARQRHHPQPGQHLELHAPRELPNYMLKSEGDPVEADEPIAETRPFIKWFKTTVKAPISGTLESISKITGQVIFRAPPRPVQVQAYIDGNVIEILPEDGVIVETTGAFVQGIFGKGGEIWGPLRVISKEPVSNFNPRSNRRLSAREKSS